MFDLSTLVALGLAVIAVLGGGVAYIRGVSRGKAAIIERNIKAAKKAAEERAAMSREAARAERNARAMEEADARKEADRWARER